MKVTQINNDGNEYGEHQSTTVKVDGAVRFRIREGEPEDMILGRDLSSAYSVPFLMQAAYEAGKRGEEFEIEVITETEDN